MLDNIILGTQRNFEAVTTKPSPIALAYFWASWCPPCKTFEPCLQQLANAYSTQLIIIKINVDEEAELTKKFAIKSVPTTRLYKYGSFVEAKSGLMGYHVLDRWISGWM